MIFSQYPGITPTKTKMLYVSHSDIYFLVITYYLLNVHLKTEWSQNIVICFCVLSTAKHLNQSQKMYLTPNMISRNFVNLILVHLDITQAQQLI